MKKILFTLPLIVLILVGCHKKEQMQWTSLAEARGITLSAKTSGEINKVYFQEGDLVKKGQRILEIDTLSACYQKQELLGVLQEIEAQSRLLDVQIAQAEKDLSYLNQKYNRTESLVKSEAAPDQTLDDITNLKEKAQSALLNSQRQKDIFTAKRSQINAKLNLIKKMIQDAVIIAPEDATISQIYQDQSELAKQGMPAVELISPAIIDATIYVSEKELATFKTGDILKVTIDGENSVFKGQITSINNKSEFTPKQILTPDTRTSLVYGINIRVANPDLKIKDGMPLVVTR